MYRRWKSCEVRIVSSELAGGPPGADHTTALHTHEPSRAAGHRTRSRGNSMDVLQLGGLANANNPTASTTSAGAVSSMALAQWGARAVNAWTAEYCASSSAAHRRRRDHAQLAEHCARLRATVLVLSCTSEGQVAATPLVLPSVSWGVWGPDARLPEHGDRNAPPWWNLPSLHTTDVLTSAPLPRSCPPLPLAQSGVAAYAAKMRLHREAQIKYTTPREDKMLVYLNAHALASERTRPPATRLVAAAADGPAGAAGRATKDEDASCPSRQLSPRMSTVAVQQLGGDAVDGVAFCLWDEAPSPPRPADARGGLGGVPLVPAAAPAAPLQADAHTSVRSSSDNAWSESSGSDSEGSGHHPAPRARRSALAGCVAAIGSGGDWRQLLWSNGGGRRRARAAEDCDGDSTGNSSSSSASSAGRRRRRAKARRSAPKPHRTRSRPLATVPPLPESPMSSTSAMPPSPQMGRAASASAAVPCTPPLVPRSPSLRHATSENMRARKVEAPSSPSLGASPVFRSMRALRKSGRSRNKNRSGVVAGLSSQQPPAAHGSAAGLQAQPAAVGTDTAVPAASHAPDGQFAQAVSAAATQAPAAGAVPPSERQSRRHRGSKSSLSEQPGSDGSEASKSSTTTDSVSSVVRHAESPPPPRQPWVVHSYLRYEPAGSDGGVFVPPPAETGSALGALVPFPCTVPSAVLAGLRCVISFPQGSAAVISPHTFGPGGSPVVPPPPALHAWDSVIPLLASGAHLPATQLESGQPQQAAQVESPQRWFGRGAHWLPRHGGSRDACLADAYTVPGASSRQWDVLLGAQGRAVEVWGMPPSARQYAEQMNTLLLDAPHMHSGTVTSVHACRDLHRHSDVRLHIPSATPPVSGARGASHDSTEVTIPPITAVSGDLLGQVHLWEVPNTASIAVCDLHSGRVMSPLEATVAAAGRRRGDSVSEGSAGIKPDSFADAGDVAPWSGGVPEPEAPLWARSSAQLAPSDDTMLPSLLGPGEQGRLAYRMQLGEREQLHTEGGVQGGGRSAVLPKPGTAAQVPMTQPADGRSTADVLEQEAVVAVHVGQHTIAAGGSLGTVCVWQRQWRARPGGRSEAMPKLLLHCQQAHSIVRVLHVWEGAIAPGHPVRVTVASGGGDGSVRLWLLKSCGPHPGAPISDAAPTFTVSPQELRAHSAPVTALACDRDVLVTAARDGKVKLWSASRAVHLGRCLRTIALGEGGSSAATAAFGSARKRASARKLPRRSDVLGSAASVIPGGLGGAPDDGFATSILLQNGILLVGTSTARIHALAAAPFDPLFGTSVRQGGGSAPPPPGTPTSGAAFSSPAPERGARKSRKGPRLRRGGGSSVGGGSTGASRRSARDLAAAVAAGRHVPMDSSTATAAGSSIGAAPHAAAAAGAGGSPLPVVSSGGRGRDKRKVGKKKKRR